MVLSSEGASDGISVSGGDKTVAMLLAIMVANTRCVNPTNNICVKNQKYVVLLFMIDKNCMWLQL